MTDVATPATLDPTRRHSTGFIGRKPDITSWGVALSAMHVPTGLFVQGHYNAADYGGQIMRGQRLLGSSHRPTRRTPLSG